MTNKTIRQRNQLIKAQAKRLRELEAICTDGTLDRLSDAQLQLSARGFISGDYSADLCRVMQAIKEGTVNAPL